MHILIFGGRVMFKYKEKENEKFPFNLLATMDYELGQALLSIDGQSNLCLNYNNFLFNVMRCYISYNDPYVCTFYFYF